MDVISDPSLDVRNAGAALEASPLWRYDAILLTLGVNDALAFTSIRVWEKRLAGLLAEITALAPPRMELFVIGIQPIRSIPGFDSPMGGLVDRHAAMMNQVSSEVCSRLPRVSFVPLSALPRQAGERHRSPGEYARWGRELAVTTAPLLDARWLAVNSGSGFPTDVVGVGGDSTDARKRAVEDLHLPAGSSDRRVEHVVDVARRVFGTQIALFAVLDDDRLLHLARTGTDLADVPLTRSFCNVAVGYRDGIVIPDARQDSRFLDQPLLVGGQGIRFYAGYPIECPDGERIGALCMLDPEPRPADVVDLSLLRELALLIQRELWRPIATEPELTR